jgi:D-alanyl-D-alanine-carboxypeptidase/D-alanyl-D-alanine-endopeptidase
LETPVIHISSPSSSPFVSTAHSAFAAKFRTASKLLLPCTLLLAESVSIASQQPLTLADAALRGQTIYQQSAFTGMVLVVVRNHAVLINGYGETAPGSAQAPDPNSEIRLCSVSKVLTADLFTQLAAEGKVKLTDALQSYSPRGTVIPTGLGGRPITLLDLATHTSGLPREVSSYPRKTPHFTFPDYDFRWKWAPSQILISVPGTAALYSNIGFDFLGDALAKASGKSYAQLLHERLLQPLGMWDTTLFPSADQCARLLQAFKNEGPCTQTEASGASGGVYSTPADMVKLLQYLLHIPGSPAQPAGAQSIYLKPSQLKSTQGLRHAGIPTGIGLAWIQLGDPDSASMILEKTGGGGGFASYVAISPSQHTGVFLAATEGKGHSQIDFFHEANNLLADLANVPQLPQRAHRAPTPRRHPARRRRAPATAPAAHSGK